MDFASALVAKEEGEECRMQRECEMRVTRGFFLALKSPKRYLENNTAHVFLLIRRKSVYFKLLFATQTLLQTRNCKEPLKNLRLIG